MVDERKQRPMKILVFSTLYPNAVQQNHGIFVETRLLELRERHNVQPTVIAPVPWYPAWLSKWRGLPDYHLVDRREIRNGIEIEHPRYPVIPGVSWRIAPYILRWFSKRLARSLHNKSNFKLIDAHFAFPDGVAATMLASDLNLPCLITARGSDINDSPLFFLPKKFLKWSLESASHVITVSEQLKTRIESLFDQVNRISVLPNGVDTEKFTPTNSGKILETYDIREPYLLSVGSLRELKGHHLLIEAFAQREELKDYTLVIAGTGAMRNTLESLTASLGVADRVKLVGDIPNNELPRLYTAASLFVLASSSEGCPNVVLESLACGTPVVATNVGAVPDLLPERLLPFMVSQRTPASIGSQVIACLEANVAPGEIREHALTLGWESTCLKIYEIMSSYSHRE